MRRARQGIDSSNLQCWRLYRPRQKLRRRDSGECLGRTPNASPGFTRDPASQSGRKGFPRIEIGRYQPLAARRQEDNQKVRTAKISAPKTSLQILLLAESASWIKISIRRCGMQPSLNLPYLRAQALLGPGKLQIAGVFQIRNDHLNLR